jgi:FtsH-binding integral membrane protein
MMGDNSEGRSASKGQDLPLVQIIPRIMFIIVGFAVVIYLTDYYDQKIIFVIGSTMVYFGGMSLLGYNLDIGRKLSGFEICFLGIFMYVIMTILYVGIWLVG